MLWKERVDPTATEPGMERKLYRPVSPQVVAAQNTSGLFARGSRKCLAFSPLPPKASGVGLDASSVAAVMGLELAT